MSQTLTLYRLQQTDSQIDHAEARLQVIQLILDDNVELREAEGKAARAELGCQTANTALKQAEQASQDLRIKIEQTEASLYGGKGHSPKELQDLQNDVAALKRHKATLDDSQLDAMLAAEEAGNVSQAAQQELLLAKQNSMQQNGNLHDEQNILRKGLEKLFAEREAITSSVPADALKLYDQLRIQRRGIAVATISDGSCSACGSGLSPAQRQASRSSSQIGLCPSCGRILYGN